MNLTNSLVEARRTLRATDVDAQVIMQTTALRSLILMGMDYRLTRSLMIIAIEDPQGPHHEQLPQVQEVHEI